MKSIPFSFLFAFFSIFAWADDSIRLPWGTVVSFAEFEVRPNWRIAFPPDRSFYAEKYADGKLKGLHGRNAAKLDGASIALYENGKPRMLGFYPRGIREGSFYLWNEEGHLLLYSKYQNGKKHGITCLFRDREPWLVQEWDKGILKDETLLAGEGSVFAAMKDEKQFAESQKRLSDLEKQLAIMESALRKKLKSWSFEEDKRLKQEQENIRKPLALAQDEEQDLKKDKELAEQNRAAADLIARTGGKRIVGIAKAEKDAASRASQSASKDLKEAEKKVKDLTIETQHDLEKMDKAIAARNVELYRYAIAELEKSLPQKAASSPPESTNDASTK